MFQRPGIWVGLVAGGAAGALATAPAGAVVPTTRGVENASSQQLNGTASYPAISGDGRFVAFASTATNTASPPTDAVRQIYLLDRATGQLRLVSHGPAGERANSASNQA